LLQDPNQLIRASALRVLSSIRVSMIVPIMMLAIKESVSDMSPYVRKTAAHAIPKLYRSVAVRSSCVRMHSVCFLFCLFSTTLFWKVCNVSLLVCMQNVSEIMDFDET